MSNITNDVLNNPIMQTAVNKPEHLVKKVFVSLRTDTTSVLNMHKSYYKNDSVDLYVTLLDDYGNAVLDNNPQANVKVYYQNESGKTKTQYRQDDDIVVADGGLIISIPKGYLGVGINTIRTVVYDTDQQIYSQPFTLNCHDTGIASEDDSIIVDDSINVKDEFILVDKKITDVNSQLDTKAKNLQEQITDVNSQLDTKAKNLQEQITDVNSQLDTNVRELNDKKLNKTDVLSMANMGQDVKEAMTGGSVAVVGRDMVTDANVVDGSLKVENLSDEYWETTYNKIKITKVESLDSGVTISNLGDIVKIVGTGTGNTIKIFVDKPIVTEGLYYLKFTTRLADVTLSLTPYYVDGTSGNETYINHEFGGLNLLNKPIDYFSLYIPDGCVLAYENKVFMVEDAKGTWDYIYKYRRKIVLKEELDSAIENLSTQIFPLMGKRWYHVGDSIGAGNGATLVNWQKDVSDYFKMSFVNCGIGGRTTGGMGNNPALSPNQYDLVKTDVDILSFSGGTNDFIQNVTLADVRKAIIKNFNDYKDKNAKVKIFMVNIMNGLTKINGGTLQEQAKNDLNLTPYDYAKCYLDTCSEIGIPCLNLFGVCGVNIYNSNKFIVDGIHPNDEGYKMIIKSYIDFINSIINYLI